MKDHTLINVYRVESSFHVMMNAKVKKIRRDVCVQMTPYDGMGDRNSMQWLKSVGIEWGAFRANSSKKNTPIPQEDKLLVQNAQQILRAAYAGRQYQEDVDYIPVWLIDLYHFAFDSEHAMMRWFSREEREQLKEKGFYLAIYAVPDEYVILGDSQLMFRKSHAELVDFITL